MGEECSKYGERRDPYRVVVGTPKGSRPLGRARQRIILKWIFEK
jgi:hypothetical protein